MTFSEHALFWFAMSLGVGVIVSIDVGALIRSQYRDFAYDKNMGGEPVRYVFPTAVMHATWHAVFFLIYMAVINFAITKIPDFLLIFLSSIGEFLKRLNLPIPDGIRDTLVVVELYFGILLIIFIWYTYAEKITDNLADNTGPDGPQLNRIDLKAFYRILRTLPILRRFWDHALAFTVAVDMLAISALIRVYFEGAGDTGFGKDDLAAHYSLIQGTNLIQDVLIFGGTIWLMVFSVAYIVGRHAQKSNQEASLHVLFLLRLIEPLFVFAAAGYAIAHIILPPSLGIDGEPIGRNLISVAIYAVLMTLSLLIAKGCAAVREAVSAGRNVSVENFKVDTRLSVFGEVLALLKWTWNHMKAIVISGCVFIALSLLYVLCCALHRRKSRIQEAMSIPSSSHLLPFGSGLLHSLFSSSLGLVSVPRNFTI